MRRSCLRNPKFFRVLFSVLLPACLAVTEANAQTYCTITRLSPQYGDYITNVTLSGINNTSTYTSSVSVADYTAKIANVVTEDPVQLSVTYKITSGGPDFVYAFIDWNGNGKLNDGGEVYTLASNKGNTPGGAGGAGATVAVTVTPPKAAALKDVRMRIMIVTDEDGIGANPCFTLGWNVGGEAEDYTVRITGPSAPATPGSFLASKSSVCKGAAGVAYTIPKVADATGYTWSYTPAAGVTVNRISDTSVTLDFSASAASGTLSVTADNSVGSSAPRSVNVTVNSLPVIQTSATAAVCKGSTVTLNATPSGGSWSSGATGVATIGSSSGVLSGMSAGNAAITYTYTDANSCTNTASVAATVNDLPSVTVTPSGSQTVCKGDSLLLTASSGGGVSYEWKLGTTQVGTAATHRAATAGSYTVTVTQTGTNCKATSAATVLTLHSVSTGTISPAGPVTLCSGDSVILSLGSGTAGYTYEWKNGTAHVGSGGSSYTAKTSGSYKAVVTEGPPTGCTDSTQEVTVTVYNRPSALVTPGDTSFCAGGILTLKSAIQDTGLQYLWMKNAAPVPQATADSLDVQESGAYTLVLQRNNLAGCSDTAVPVTVTVHPLPLPGISWDGRILHATPGFTHYQWLAGSQPVAGATDSTFEVPEKGWYTVNVTDTNGCANSETYQVEELLYAGAVLPGAADIRIYPNPASSVLFISSPFRVNALLSGMDGREILRLSDAREISLAPLADGIYLLQLTDRDGHVLRHERLVKKSGAR